MRPFIVVSDGFDKSLFKKLCENPQLEVHPQSKLTPSELNTLLPKVEGLIVRSATQVNRELLAMAPKLTYVVRAGAGVDNIDVAACRERGIVVANTPGANSNAAAEHAVALMMSLLRKIPWAHQSMVEGRWDKNLFGGQELTEKTVGIVGYGHIGKLVAKRLAGFEPKVLIYDTMNPTIDLPYAKQVNTIEEIFTQSDIVTLHAPLLPATKNLIDKRLLSMMPSHALLIDAARGGIVNEEDLYQHLKEQKIRGAALDVFKEEPLSSNSPLRTLSNIILTPHLGASTDESQFRVGEMAVNQLIEFFVNNKAINTVK